jgi:hypothetical protein
VTGWNESEARKKQFVKGEPLMEVGVVVVWEVAAAALNRQR